MPNIKPYIAIFPVALRRLTAQWLLYACALLALTLTTGLAVAVPLYAEGASLRLLERELVQAENRTGRTPFALLIRFLASTSGTQPWNRVAPVDTLISGPGLPFLGLPTEGFARHARTAPLPLVLDVPGANPQPLGSTPIGFLSGMEAQIRLLDGTLPTNPNDVIVARTFANRAGLNVGDQLTLRASSPISLRIAGIWEPMNPRDQAWFYTPDAFDQVLLASETNGIALFESQKLTIDQMVWFIQLRQTGLTPAQTAPLLDRINALGARAAGGLPGLRVEQGPTVPLTTYRQLVNALTLQLSALSALTLALATVFLVLVAGALARRQQGEIALLKTRGIRTSQILLIDLAAWLILGALALLLGLPLGALAAQILGSVRSFLALTDTVPTLVISWSGTALGFGLAALLVGLIAALIPAWLAARRTLREEQRQQSRVEGAPLWQRGYLDLLLLGIATYSITTLRNDPETNPVNTPQIVLLPVLLALALGLIIIRILPKLLALAAWLASLTRGTVVRLVCLNLARQPATYRGTVLLLVLTLSIATFSVALARTLDADLVTAISYQIGGDTQLIESGEMRDEREQRQPEPGEARFLFVPVSAHLDVPGIRHAVRVGQFDATLQTGGPAQAAQLIGIDRRDFPQVVGFDPTWAGGESLGGLMNRLASRPRAAIVSRAVAGRGVNIGQALNLDVTILGVRRTVSTEVVAIVDYWPGVYPEEGPFIISNLDYIFEQLGDQYPYDVWIDRDPTVPLAEIADGVRRQGVLLIDTRDRDTLLNEAATEPRRQGLFGMLSLGFAAATLLTLIGFVLMALLNARRRTIELGVLAALGLAQRAQVGALLFEQGLLVLIGVAAGSGIGALVAAFTVPLLRVGVGPHPGTPPTPATPSDDTLLIVVAFGAIALLLALLVLALLASRLRLAQAVRLGDTPE
jgi:putative ABC transport system permease protein